MDAALDYHASTEQWEIRLREAGWTVHEATGYWIDPEDSTTAQPIGEAINIQCRRDGGITPEMEK